jgi:uncharacterized LabA/DUF88 family protein
MGAIKYSDQRVGVLVDVQNMYHSAKSLYGARANFLEILKTATAGRQLIRAIAYASRADTDEEQGFFEAMEKAGFEMKTKELQVFAGGMKKGNWDVDIALDAIRLSHRLDVIVLVAGDGDFVPLVDYLKNVHGVKTEVIAFGKSASGKLREAADDFIDLSQNYNKYLIRPRKFVRPMPIRPVKRGFHN